MIFDELKIRLATHNTPLAVGKFNKTKEQALKYLLFQEHVIISFPTLCAVWSTKAWTE